MPRIKEHQLGLNNQSEKNYPVGQGREIVDFIRSKPKSSMGEVSNAIGLAWSSVSNVMPILLERGWIKKPESNSIVRKGKAGPLSQVFEVNPDAGYFLGVQVEPEFIRTTCLDFSFKKMDGLDTKISNSDNHASFIRQLRSSLSITFQKLEETGKLQGLMSIGFSLSNQFLSVRDPQLMREIISMMDKKSLESIPISIDRSSRCGAQQYIDNEKIPPNDVVYVNLDESVSKAIIINGRLRAGQPEHYPLKSQSKATTCGCGINECIGYELSESAMVSEWNRTNNESGNHQLDQIADLVKEGDPTAKKFFDEYGKKLGNFLYADLLILNPDTVAVGGKIAKYWDLFYPFFNQTLWEKLPPGSLSGLKFVRLKQGEDAKAIGAAISAYHKLES